MRGYGNERRDHSRSAAMTRVILCGVIDKGIVMAVRLSSNTTADDVRQEIVSALNLTAELQLFLAQNEDGTWWRPDATRLLEEQDTRGLCEVTSTSSLGHFFTQSQRDAAIHILAKVVEAQRPETTKSTIRCGFYGCGLVSEFEIDLNLTVQDLMNQIVERTRTPRVPQLYLTRTGRHWLRVEDGMKGVLDQKIGHRYTELCSSDVLHERFGYDFESCKEHLHVLVELAGPRQVSVDQSFLELTQCYRSIGKMCKSNKEVQEVLDAVVSVQCAGQPTPFIVVQGSSGVGKTQIAFTLMENHDMDVFYIVSQVSAAGELIQPIYGAVRTRSVVFSQCVEDDLKKVCKGGVEDIGTNDYLYTYSFITALLRGHTHFVGRGLRRDVMEAIRCRSRPCIFFLDEFPDCSMGGTERLRFMRNVFRSFGLTVTVSSTNESARNMLSQQTQSRGSDTRMWCYIVPIFAEFQAVSSDVIPTKLRYVIANSRPMFAQAALGYLRENLWSSNPVDYMDSMAGHIATQCSENKMRLSQGFRTGQVCLFLCASYVDDQENRLICDHFAVLAENMAFGLQLSSERRLSKRDEHTPWVCRSVFPPVGTDLLLYLCFLGGKAFGAMRGSNGNRIPFRKALQEAEDAEWSVICFKNTTQNSNDGMRLEALATGAMVLASHANGFAGVPFKHFFFRAVVRVGRTEFPSLVGYVATQGKFDHRTILGTTQHGVAQAMPPY